MTRKFGDISDAEMDVLQSLWREGPGTVRDLDARLRPVGRAWAYTTIQTLLNRLETKGYVKADKTGPAHVYRSSVTRDRFLSRRLRQLADEVCDGASTPLVAALVRGGKFTSGEIDEFRRLIDEWDNNRGGE